MFIVFDFNLADFGLERYPFQSFKAGKLYVICSA